MIFNRVLGICLGVLFFVNLMAQDELPLNWHLLDKQKDGLPGISLEKTYVELLKDKKSRPVIVAILDSGVDYNHEDLKSVMWVNPGEIPGNKVDDDSNGYVDDIYGWNFIGGPNGNVAYDTYESTRLYAQMRYKFDEADPKKLNSTQKKEYEFFLKLKKDVEDRRASAEKNLEQINQTENFILIALNALEIAMDSTQLMNSENLEKLDGGENQQLQMGLAIAKQVVGQGLNFKNVGEFKSFILKDFTDGKKHFSKEVEYAFNPDYDPRAIVGDDYTDFGQKFYGNNDVIGSDASHGTHVAGIVAAERKNNLGMDGVADHVRIMAVRCVPDGDERDKDVANAIRYAVDNGASVINMSFGKGYSPQKEYVDAAIKYAEEKDVLLVHAAGNAASNNDKVENFPNKYFKKKKFLSCNKVSNWIEVGASQFESGPELVAGFSNYGKKQVDLFAPGVQIYSTMPNQSYAHEQGTSMASPVVAGVAALLRSYFPELTAKQVRKIILKSTAKPDYEVINPGTKKTEKLNKMSVTGGLVNVYEAVQLALKTKGKKKIKDERTGPGEIVPKKTSPRS
ncbi:MAG: S8 family peptidase [Saprospiraceae bacterium]|nr:S8 family peptidase [Saprospiraceae bacterium]